MLLKGSPGVLGDVPKFWGAFEASQPNLEVFLLDGRILEGGLPRAGHTLCLLTTELVISQVQGVV